MFSETTSTVKAARAPQGGKESSRSRATHESHDVYAEQGLAVSSIRPVSRVRRFHLALAYEPHGFVENIGDSLERRHHFLSLFSARTRVTDMTIASYASDVIRVMRRRSDSR